MTVGVGVSVPEFDARVEIADPRIVAPLQNLACVDAPRQINEHVTRTEVPTEHFAEIVFLDAVEHVRDTFCQLRGNTRPIVDEIHDRNPVGSHDVAEQKRKGALRHRSTAEHQYSALEGHTCCKGLHRGASLTFERCVQ